MIKVWPKMTTRCEKSECLIWVLLDDIDHMRKVVAYCKRHLAQEEKAKHDTDSKSYKSLKNWGHDAQKAWCIHNRMKLAV